MADEGSMLNTPPTFGWYFAGLVFKWLKKQGGLAAMAERNRAKAELLYAPSTSPGFYRNPVAKNVPLVDERAVHAGRARSSTRPSCAEAKAAGLVNSKATARSAACARPSTTRCRSKGVEALVEFMKEFQRRHG